MNSAVFLDRDGVLNKSLIRNGLPYAPKQISEVEVLPKVTDSILLLKKYGFKIVVVTNQPDVARGKSTKKQVESINNYLAELIGVDNFYTCFHDEDDNCTCRKPKNGLLRKSATDLGINLNSSFMVGDRWRDIEAGQSAGCRSYFIDYSYNEKQPNMPFVRVKSLFEATQHIVGSLNDENI